MRKTIATLTVHDSTGIGRTDEAVVSGVPIAPGAVSNTNRLVLLNADGRRLPMQADALARWNDGSAKWVLVTTPRVSLAAGKSARLTLVCEPGDAMGNRSRDKDSIQLGETPGGLRVDNGRVRFLIRRTGKIVSTFESRGKNRWQRRATDLDLVTTIERDTKRTSCFASLADRSIEIESRGPLRSLIAVRGMHRSKNGHDVCPYVLRLEILSGSNRVRCTHSVIYDGSPDKDFIRSSEVVLTADVGRNQHFGFGGDEGHEVRFPRQIVPFHADFRYAELWQDSVTHWRVRRWVDLNRRDVFCEEGVRSDGWMELTGDDGRVAVAVREFWQNHPKSLCVDAETGKVRIGLYPERAERLDLRRYSDLIYPLAYEAPCTWKEEVLPFDPAFGAHGIRKTHDFMLLLDEPDPSGTAARYNRPLRLQWRPSYLAKTRVLWPVASGSDPRWAKQINDYLDFLSLAMLRDGGTGWLDYFDLPHGFNTHTGRWHHDSGGRGYINNEGMPCLGLWQAYFATGREDAFVMARAMTRHNADIDSYHLGPHAGLGSRHNVNHWGDMCKEPRISQPVDKKFLYYLTGDRSVLDLVRVMLDMFDRSLAKPTRWPATAHIPALVSTLLVAQETGMADVNDWLKALADSLAQGVNELGQMCAWIEVDASRRTARALPESGPISFMMFSCFGGVQSFAELAERYDHDALRQALVRMARYQMLPVAKRCKLEPQNLPSVYTEVVNTFRGLDLLGYAYQVTGDPKIRRHARRGLRFVRVRIVDQPESRYGIRGTGMRRIPAQYEWPERDAKTKKMPAIWYPFPGSEMAQMFEMAVYLHKSQGIMVLC
jgi:hypothetical protein